MKRMATIVLALAAVTGMAGCGDPIDRLLSAGEQRHQLMHRISERSDVAAEVLDHLMEADSTRARVLDRVMADAQARQDLLARVAKDRTLIDGAINFAAQDSSMRDHVMTLVKGMEMGGGR
jgi:hypothetical protein